MGARGEGGGHQAAVRRARGAGGVLMSAAADDRDAQDRVAAFLKALAQLGWTEGRNVRIE